MRKNQMARFAMIVLGAVLLPLARQASAQQYPYRLEYGVPTYTTADSVPMGIVNLASGNLHIEIPIVSVPQRGGVSFVVKMVYDSRVWKILDNGTSLSWQPTNVPNSSMGWRMVTSLSAAPQMDTTVYPCTYLGDTYYWWKSQNYRYTDTSGTVRRFPLYAETSNYCHTAGQGTSSGPSLDTLGQQMNLVTSSMSVKNILAHDGTQIFQTGSKPVQDTNGNYLTTSGSNVIDTLNRTVWKKEADQYCGNGSLQTYTVLTSQGTSTYKFCYLNISIHTNFGVSGVTEYQTGQYGPFQAPLQYIQLPDGSQYNFTYEYDWPLSGNYGHGLLASMTLPTGATVTFTHQNFGTQADATQTNRRIDTATWGGATRTYTLPPAGGGNASVASPAGDVTLYTLTVPSGYRSAWNTQTKVYTGNQYTGTLELTLDHVYDLSLTDPLVGGPAFVRRTSTTTTVPTPSGNLMSKTEATYDTFTYNYQGTNYTGSRGIVQTVKEYAYGSGTPGALQRQKVFTYLHDSDSNYLAKNILNLVTNSQVQNASGTKLSEVKITYDSGSLTNKTGVTHHDTSAYGTSFTYRGNPTLVENWIGGSNYLSTSTAYDITGQVVSATDSNSNTTTMSYTNSYYTDNGQNPPATYSPTPPTTNAFVTQITQPIIGSSSMAYYYGSGSLAFATDPNGKTTYQHYQDSLNRHTKTNGPGGGWSQAAYTSVTQTDFTAAITGSTTVQQRLTTDTLGRPIQSSLVNDPQGTTYKDTTYDTTGRLVTATNPFRSTGDPTYGISSVQLDGMNRTIKTTLVDNNFTEAFYGGTVGGAGGRTSQLCSTSTYGYGYPVLSKDEAGKKRQAWTDALGRLIETDEPDASGALTMGTCYQYNLLGNLVQVDQGIDLGSGYQTRTMAYDALGRLTTETTPEGGTINLYYTISGGALCSGNPSAVCRATDARSITTTYTYDALNRLTGKTYSNGDPSVTYSYDQTSCNSLTITNGKGRRTCLTDGSGTTAWSYDAEGHVLTEQRTINGSPNVTKTISYTYNLNGSLAQITYPSGFVVVNEYSVIGRLSKVRNSANTVSYASSPSFAATGALTGLTLGSVSGGFAGIARTYTYNNRLQPVNMNAKHTSGTVTVMDYTYNFVSASINDGHVKSVTNNLVAGRSQTYTYDEMNRLKTAQSQATSGGDCWGMSYGYDRYANLLSASITKCTGPVLSLSVDNTTNKITNTGFTYDAAGNLTNDGFNSYTWNAEGRMASYNSGSVTYTYDGDGKRVKKSNGKLYWYGIGGQVLEETDLSGDLITDYVYFGGMRIARRDASGTIYYFLADRLGNARVLTNASGTVVEESDFYPFGGERPITDTLDNQYKFTGHERDAESGLDHTLFRQYSCNQGRWLSPDRHRGNKTNPQSFNRYAYAWNDAANLVDSDGAYPCPPGWVENPEYLEQGGPPCSPLEPWPPWDWDIFSGVPLPSALIPPPEPTCAERAGDLIPTSEEGIALAKVLLTENSYGQIGKRQYQAGDSLGNPTGPMIWYDTVRRENELMLDVIANLAQARGRSLIDMASDPDYFEGLKKLSNRFEDYLEARAMTTACDDLMDVSRAVNAFLEGGAVPRTSYNQWRAVVQRNRWAGEPFLRNGGRQRPGDLRVGGTDFFKIPNP